MTDDDAENMMKLHHTFYRVDEEFKDKIENHERTMWLLSKNNDVRKKMQINLSKSQKQTSSQL